MSRRHLISLTALAALALCGVLLLRAVVRTDAEPAVGSKGEPEIPIVRELPHSHSPTLEAMFDAELFHGSDYTVVPAEDMIESIRNASSRRGGERTGEVDATGD
ncbi:MAG: hypothetical protein GY711_10875 [bacterium]|nr:hypothetical protein [bacterium]